MYILSMHGFPSGPYLLNISFTGYLLIPIVVYMEIAANLVE